MLQCLLSDATKRVRKQCPTRASNSKEPASLCAFKPISSCFRTFLCPELFKTKSSTVLLYSGNCKSFNCLQNYYTFEILSFSASSVLSFERSQLRAFSALRVFSFERLDQIFLSSRKEFPLCFAQAASFSSGRHREQRTEQATLATIQGPKEKKSTP